MNRVKKELRKKGIKLESDYEYMPYGDLEAVTVNSESAEVGIHHTGISLWFVLTRKGTLEASPDHPHGNYDFGNGNIFVNAR